MGVDYSSDLRRNEAGRLCLTVRFRDADPIRAMMSAAKMNCETKPAVIGRMELVFDTHVQENEVRTLLARFAAYD